MTPQSVTYRVRTASKTAILAHLLACDADYNPTLSQRVDLLEYTSKLSDKAATFEAWEGSSLVGLVAAYLNDMERGHGFITNVSVLQRFAGRGIAKTLLQTCVDEARRLGMDEINLHVARGNSQAIDLYRKIGFVECGTDADLLLMRHQLTGKK